MKFLVDNQLPAALARFLVTRGLDGQYVLDVDLADASDAEIWEQASRNDSVVISKDEDFLYLANGPSAKARLISGFGWGIAARRRFLPQSKFYGRRSSRA